MASFLPPLLLFLVALFVELVTDLPVPAPQVVVRSQSLLYNDQPGRQVDLSQVRDILIEKWNSKQDPWSEFTIPDRLRDLEKTIFR